ncbi:hypothetical protein L202_07203 [Cryptococcus amylolentus CBS 6039]|uniref:Thioredoxin-like fold domain-containing protein n=1 Tax=Cryptococcus amylolentus CBS 6039 TaxID=1295533 RepID=A0A1E3HD32_9TREE|nr:hypothetical protein L202_07203 [Cryptococcus amylolentus CBS 6039]ODN73656.1 hypothetical protein L202_07203 [Cryptococcus amylolentus CBS 6039]
MSSPIHSFLFSPPPSPPSRGSDHDYNHGLTSLKSLLLPVEFIPRSSSEKGRSKRTPSQSRLGFETLSLPSPRGMSTDLEATPKARRRSVASTTITHQPINVPSSPQVPFPSTIPKPFLRILFLACVVLSSALIMYEFPAMRPHGIAKGIASEGGRGFVELIDPLGEEAYYQPPQTQGARMLWGKKSVREESVVMEQLAQEVVAIAAHPKATRPALRARPLPESHELLALQSYILSSAYNVVPSSVDPSLPLDANTILGIGSHKLGALGGERETAWLKDVEREWADEVVIWYGGDGTSQYPHSVLDIIESTHNSNRHPTFIPVHARSDRETILAIFARLGLPLAQSPIIMIDNKPIIGDLETLEEMKLSGELGRRLTSVGWKHVEKRVGTKPKMAVIKKQPPTDQEEAEEALVET